jgi:ABC-2 type transport system permease protein
MRGVVFEHTLRHTWLTMFLWGMGLGLMGLFVILMTPLLDVTRLAAVLETIPPVILKAAGMPDDYAYALTPEGIIAVGFFGKFALFFIVYPVVMGMRITANEEDEGIMDVLLSLPIPRRRLVLEKFAAYLVTIAGVAVIILVSLWLGTLLVAVPFTLARMLENIFNLSLMLVFILAFTAFMGALLHRKQTALAVVTLFVVFSFMVETLGAMASGSLADGIRLLSFFSHYNAAGVMRNGLAWGSVALLVILSVVLFAGSLYAFQRRDIGV